MILLLVGVARLLVERGEQVTDFNAVGSDSLTGSMLSYCQKMSVFKSLGLFVLEIYTHCLK